MNSFFCWNELSVITAEIENKSSLLFEMCIHTVACMIIFIYLFRFVLFYVAPKTMTTELKEVDLDNIIEEFTAWQKVRPTHDVMRQ